MHELSFTFTIECARVFEYNISCKEQTPTNKKEDANNEQPEYGEQDQRIDGTQEEALTYRGECKCFKAFFKNLLMFCPIRQGIF